MRTSLIQTKYFNCLIGSKVIAILGGDLANVWFFQGESLFLSGHPGIPTSA